MLPSQTSLFSFQLIHCSIMTNKRIYFLSFVGYMPNKPDLSFEQYGSAL